MRQNTKREYTAFVEEQDTDDFAFFNDKDKKKNRMARKQAARKRRQLIKEQRYEDDWN